MSKLNAMVDRQERTAQRMEGIRRIYSQLLVLGVPEINSPLVDSGVWCNTFAVYVQTTGFNSFTTSVSAAPVVVTAPEEAADFVRYQLSESKDGTAQEHEATEERAVEFLATWWFNRLKGEQV